MQVLLGFVLGVALFYIQELGKNRFAKNKLIHNLIKEAKYNLKICNEINQDLEKFKESVDKISVKEPSVTDIFIIKRQRFYLMYTFIKKELNNGFLYERILNDTDISLIALMNVNIDLSYFDTLNKELWRYFEVTKKEGKSNMVGQIAIKSHADMEIKRNEVRVKNYKHIIDTFVFENNTWFEKYFIKVNNKEIYKIINEYGNQDELKYEF